MQLFLEPQAGSYAVKFGVVKNVFGEVSGYLGSVLTISDQNRVLRGDFTADQICWFGKISRFFLVKFPVFFL